MKKLRIIISICLFTALVFASRADIRTYRFSGTRISGTSEFGETLTGTIHVDPAFAPFPIKYKTWQYIWNAIGTSDISIQTSTGADHTDACALLSFDDGRSEAQYVNSWHSLGYGWNYSTFVSIRFYSYEAGYSGDGIPDFPDPLPSFPNVTQSIISWQRFDELGFREALFRIDSFELVLLTVIINGCDTGVKDVVVDGKRLSVWIAEAAAAAKNHGQLVSALTQIANEARDADLITQREKAILTAAIAKTVN